MLPALMALQPAIKYGVPAAVLVALLGGTNTCSYVKGKRVVQQEWDATIAQQAAESAQQAVHAQVMESKIVRAIDVQERAIQQKAKTIKKKVSTYAHAKQTVTISAPLVRMHDELRGLSDQAGPGLSTPDPGAGTPEVPSGGMGAAAAPLVPVEADGESVTLTTEELAQAVTDFYEKYALMRNSYRGFSEWNDGREKLERARFGMEDPE